MKNRQCLFSPTFNPLAAQLTSLDPSHVAWTRDCLDRVAIGGKWIIPRSAGYEIKSVFVRNEKTV